MTLTIQSIKAFSDNYIWLFYQQGRSEAFVVDPGDAKPVLEALETFNLTLAGIVVTHQHPDHIGGIPELLERYPVTVYGPDDIGLVTQPVADGDSISLAGSSFQVLSVPGHTLNHLAYFSPGEQRKPVLFCGDTLFAGGCGRLFEGTPAQMYNSLLKFAQLPGDTQAYCAHEYTLANLEFALAVDPDNTDLQQRWLSAMQHRKADLPTVPFSLETDLKTNPFLRADKPTIMAAAQNRGMPADSPVEVFAAIRHWKDVF